MRYAMDYATVSHNERGGGRNGDGVLRLPGRDCEVRECSKGLFVRRVKDFVNAGRARRGGMDRFVLLMVVYEGIAR